MNASAIGASDPPTDSYPFYVVKRTRLSRRRSSVQSYSHRHKFKLVRRLVRKSGKSSIHQKSSTERSFRFLLDLSNTLIESSWIWILLVLSAAFVLTWLMFAGFWAIISIENVDASNGTSESCLEGIESFSGYLLFSIETQTTVGYGGRYINEYCPEAIIGLVVQLVVGAAVGGSLICIVFLKMVSPTKNRHSMICQRDGELCLIFRVRDYDMRYECHTNIVAYLAEERAGELSLRALKLEKPGILIWPVEVIHKIDKSSPLWDLSAKDLILKRFEVIVVLEGECLVTSYMSRTTTSYLSREIKWGHMFSPCVRWDPVQRRYIVDHKRFNRSVEVGIPLCSAQRLDEVYEDLVYQRRPYSESGSSSKYTSPATHSPSINSPIYFRKSHDINELEELETVADVHRNPASDDEDSSVEEEGTFMDLSLEDLQRRELKSSSEPRPRTLSGTAKDFLASIQRYVKEGGGKTKSYEETAF
uniref:Uncharacterized protein n=1 Tax=Dendroctonus ponderosae TaxID=77166 RepID=A0AAR5P511_DENPD